MFAHTQYFTQTLAIFSEEHPNQCVVHVLNQGDDAWGNGFPTGFARTSQENSSAVERRLANGTSRVVLANERHFDLIRLFEAHFHYDVGRTLQ